MGWGLRTSAPVNRGDLVIEYIGEVLDDVQMQVCTCLRSYCTVKGFYFAVVLPIPVLEFILLISRNLLPPPFLLLSLSFPPSSLIRSPSLLLSPPPLSLSLRSPLQTRMTDQRKFTPNDHNFYIMQLDTGLYVDGKHKGADSRQTLYFAVLYFTLLCCTVLYCIVLYCSEYSCVLHTVLYCIALYCTEYCTVLYCAVLYYTVRHAQTSRNSTHHVTAQCMTYHTALHGITQSLLYYPHLYHVPIPAPSRPLIPLAPSHLLTHTTFPSPSQLTPSPHSPYPFPSQAMSLGLSIIPATLTVSYSRGW
jgi:hypothetical protein